MDESRAPASGMSDTSGHRAASPWKAKDPLALLKGDQLAQAFEVDASRAELRERDDSNQPREQLVGLPYRGKLPPMPLPKQDGE